MGATIRLSTINEHKDYGVFVTALYVMEASSSSNLDTQSESVTLGVRDVLTAVPVLRWEPSINEHEGVVNAAVMMQAFAIGAVSAKDYDIPLTKNAASGISFHVDGDYLRFKSSSRPLGLLDQFSFRIDPRLKWFIETTKTIGIVLHSPSKTWIQSITTEGHMPEVSVLRGSFDSKSFEILIDNAKGWKSVHIANHSVYAGVDIANDHHYRTYAATPDSLDIPEQLAYRGTCLGCGGSGRSREHCTPDWMATGQRVVPVVAPIFCVECNNHFGKKLEAPIVDLVRSGNLSQSLDSQIFAKWAVKTALALSAASDVPLDESWMKELRKGSVPDGFEVFATTNFRMSPGYIFSVSHFSKSEVKKGKFLFSLAVEGIAFVVTRRKSSKLNISVLPRVHPSPLPPVPPENMSGLLDLQHFHADLLGRMTDSQLDYTPSQPKPVKAKRA